MMLRSSLYNYNDVLFVKVTVKTTGEELYVTATASNMIYKNIRFKPFTSFISFLKEINNTQIDKTKDVDVAMPM